MLWFRLAFSFLERRHLVQSPALAPLSGYMARSSPCRLQSGVGHQRYPCYGAGNSMGRPHILLAAPILKGVAFTFLLTCIILSNTCAGQGKYAGRLQALVGTKYSQIKEIKPLAKYPVRQSDLLTPVGEGPYYTVLEILQNKSSAVVLVAKRTDTVAQKFTILDVLHIGNIPPHAAIRTVGCYQNGKVLPGHYVVLQSLKPKGKALQCYMLRDFRFVKTGTQTILCKDDLL